MFISGKFLVDSSVAIARRLKIPTMIIGLTVVAFGTSAPELLVSVRAALGGYPEMAMGNVVGSNISNILLVLALTALVYPIPVPAKSVREDWPILMVVSLVLFGFAWNGELTRAESIVLILLLVAYLLFVVLSSRKGAPRPIPEDEQNTAKAPMRIWVALLVFLVSCGGLAAGADLLVENAATIALDFGISQRLISITMVAIGTSVPELATSIIAALKKETDISVGNIIGSNIMNILSVLGITGIVRGISVDQGIARVDIPVMLGVTVLLLLMMVPAARSRITRWEGLLMIVIYLVYIYLIF